MATLRRFFNFLLLAEAKGETLNKLAKLGHALSGIILGAIMAFILAEWMAGCGQTYQDAAGVVHVGQCLIIPS
jgi:hypothetical protein